jgi:hypothetical protein
MNYYEVFKNQLDIHPDKEVCIAFVICLGTADGVSYNPLHVPARDFNKIMSRYDVANSADLKALTITDTLVPVLIEK